jgi:hypothetical protein
MEEQSGREFASINSTTGACDATIQGGRLVKGRAPAHDEFAAAMRIVIDSSNSLAYDHGIRTPALPAAFEASASISCGAFNPSPGAVDDPLNQASLKSVCRAEAKKCRRWN